jgi:hypothetical protein
LSTGWPASRISVCRPSRRLDAPKFGTHGWFPPELFSLPFYASFGGFLLSRGLLCLLLAKFYTNYM